MKTNHLTPEDFSLFIKRESKKQTNDADGLSPSSRARHIVKRLGARKMEFIATAVTCTIFAVSFAHLEY